jgi:hypothetical protein
MTLSTTRILLCAPRPLLLLLGVVALAAAGCGDKSGSGTDGGVVQADASHLPPQLDAAIAIPPDAAAAEPLDAATALDAAAPLDAATPLDAGSAGDASVRTIVERPLFGDTHPQNLLIDPSFSVRRGGGLGNWMALTGDSSQASPSFSSSLLSDSPSGISMATARLADATASTGNFELDLLAQVPGGPGPFTLQAWVSTLDAKASASLTGVTFGLLASLDDTDAVVVAEDPAKARVIAGRTWHLFTGQSAQDLSIGGFVLLSFAASANTWLLQSPEFIPVALDPSPATTVRPATARERALIAKYKHQPKISVPAGHPAISDLPRDQPRR